MKPLPATPDLKEICHRVLWFQTPEESLAEPVKLLAYAVTYGSFRDVAVLREYISDEDFIYALDNAPPGIIDGRSWGYWNAKFGRYPAPPLPIRKLILFE